MADMEGASGLEALGAGAPAFKVLRQLVQVKQWRSGQGFSPKESLVQVEGLLMGRHAIML
jgi:hypothetical protein